LGQARIAKSMNGQMYRGPQALQRVLWVLLAGLVTPAVARADAVSAVQVLREGGCGGIVPRTQPLRHNPRLDRAAELWATGSSLAAAAEANGYRADSTSGVYVSSPDSSVLEQLRRLSCRAVTGPALGEMGAYRRGQDTWLVLAAAATVTVAVAGSYAWSHPGALSSTAPAAPQLSVTPQTARGSQPAGTATASFLASRALQLVNDVRARGTRCGRRSFAPAPPLTLSGTLAGVAFGHATDMAQHNYFAHEDLIGQSPAARVRAVGYREKLVGENIAYGPQTIDEVVQGWLDSPDHCENIMDPRFAQMGIAFAAGNTSRHGLYWVQLLAAPRA